MSQVFYGAWLVRRGSLGWASHYASFAEVPILAHIQLSALYLQEGERFEMFRRQYAQAYIETVNTPAGLLGYPMPNKETDNNVWLTTDHVTFLLQAEGTVTCSAFGLIHDRSAALLNSGDVRQAMDFAVFSDDGAVVGTHHAVQLEGGRQLDEDEIQEAVLGRSQAQAERVLDITKVDLGDIPRDAEFRIHPRTRRPMPRSGA